MIKFENVEVVGFEHAIRGMRNPMNSWEKSDSGTYTSMSDTGFPVTRFLLGDEDLKLAKKLVRSGADHRKFMRQIVIYADITAPLYWWKEFDTYKVGTVANSCSTMHKIHAAPITEDDFSFEDVTDVGGIVDVLEGLRKKYVETGDKSYWRELIQLLPASYNQRRTVMLSYEVALNIVTARANHKLSEWLDFREWVRDLPYMLAFLGWE